MTISEVWPSQIMAGDTLKFRIPKGDYEPSTDTVNVYISNHINTYNFSSTEDGDYFLFNVPYTDTQNYQAGDYFLQASVTNESGERYLFAYLELIIHPSLQYGNADPRSHVKKVLDSIEALLEGKVLKDAQVYEIAGRRLEKIPIPELLSLQKQYKRKYDIERGVSNKVKVRSSW